MRVQPAHVLELFGAGDGMHGEERRDVEIGVVRELVLQHGRRPQHAGVAIQGKQTTERHQKVQPPQQVLAASQHPALRRCDPDLEQAFGRRR
jgi:hypothetical protein